MDFMGGVKHLQTKVSLALEELKATLIQLDRMFEHYESNKMIDNKAFFEKNYKMYVEARKNYEFIKKDSSRGIHNSDYVWKLIKVSKDKAQGVILSFKNIHVKDKD